MGGWGGVGAHLLVDGGRVQQEGDLLHGLPVAAHHPRHVVAPHHQRGGGRGVGVDKLLCATARIRGGLKVAGAGLYMGFLVASG